MIYEEAESRKYGKGIAAGSMQMADRNDHPGTKSILEVAQGSNMVSKASFRRKFRLYRVLPKVTGEMTTEIESSAPCPKDPFGDSMNK